LLRPTDDKKHYNLEGAASTKTILYAGWSTAVGDHIGQWISLKMLVPQGC